MPTPAPVLATPSPTATETVEVSPLRQLPDAERRAIVWAVLRAAINELERMARARRTGEEVNTGKSTQKDEPISR